MKILFFLIFFTSICLCLSAQTINYEKGSQDLSLKDTNYIYIGVTNKFNIEKEKLGIIRTISDNNGISSSLYNTYVEVSPKHEGFFRLTLEAQERKYNVLFLPKRVPDLGL